MEFRTCFNKKNITGKKFDTKESIVMAGKKIVLYDYIQANREDTEIIPTLEKYGCIDKMQTNYNQVYMDTTLLPKNIFDAKARRNKAIEIFESMSYKDRAEFNHSVDNFIENGEKWLIGKLGKKIEELNEVKQSDTATDKGGDK